jgi:hypothetical protein
VNSLDAAMAFIWFAAGEVGTGVYQVPPALTCRQIGMYNGVTQTFQPVEKLLNG